MAAFWFWVFLISAVVHALGLPLLSAAPKRFTSYIPAHVSPKRYHLVPRNIEHEDPRTSLEDYRSFDPPPDADKSKVKPSPIENGENSPFLDTTTLETLPLIPHLH